jgi:hypothetical protein
VRAVLRHGRRLAKASCQRDDARVGLDAHLFTEQNGVHLGMPDRTRTVARRSEHSHEVRGDGRIERTKRRETLAPLDRGANVPRMLSVRSQLGEGPHDTVLEARALT